MTRYPFSILDFRFSILDFREREMVALARKDVFALFIHQNLGVWFVLIFSVQFTAAQLAKLMLSLNGAAANTSSIALPLVFTVYFWKSTRMWTNRAMPTLREKVTFVDNPSR